MTRSFTEAQFKEELELAYDKGFGRGTGCNPSLIATEPYLDFREQELAPQIAKAMANPKGYRVGDVHARPGGDWLGDIEGRGD